MKKHVLYKLERGVETYWTGKFTPSDYPATSGDMEKARWFESAADAYSVANYMEDCQWWRVGKRQV